jgi:hypothetical protein
MQTIQGLVLTTVMLAVLGSSAMAADSSADTLSYAIVDTDQTWCFDDDSVIPCGASHDGQDAQYAGLQPAYQDNGDGTITDLNTSLMWIADPGDKTLYADALETLEDHELAGYDDWRLPTIKELYSLSLWSGIDVSMAPSSDIEGLEPLIDDDYFTFLYGDESGGNRVIDSQWLTSTVYESSVMNGQSCFFGFNFADGRIKCYPLDRAGGSGGYFALFVRGDTDYGVNDYVANGDGTVSDLATGLTWMQSDSGEGMDWSDAITFCADLSLAGSDDWRLPDIKELHSIVDYSRSPETTDSAAIGQVFDLTEITNEAGEQDWPFVWSSTTLLSYPGNVSEATYISFGRALGYMDQWMDVHGAGAQRSDPKVDARVQYRGPQGDATRTDNYVLCVTGGDVVESDGDDPDSLVIPSGEVAQLESAGGVLQDRTAAPSDGARADGAAAPGGFLADAAESLGVSEGELVAALGEPGSGPPDLEAAAELLGISIKELRAALPAK